MIVLRPLQSLVSSPLELTVASQPVTGLPQRGVIHILADVYISAQIADVVDKPDWSEECTLRDTGVDGSPFPHDVSKLGALTMPAQEGSHPPRQKVRDAHAGQLPEKNAVINAIKCLAIVEKQHAQDFSGFV